MKKILMSVLTVSVILGTSTIAFAAEESSVPVLSNDPVVTQTQDQTSTQTQNQTTGQGIDPSQQQTGMEQQPSTTTPSTNTSNQSAKEQFYSTVYMNKMATIVDLRVQTQSALDANKAISNQIKSALKTLNTAGDLEGQVKAAREKVKNDVTQARTLVQQRNGLRKQFQATIKSKDTATMKNIQAQVQALDSQINTLKQQSETDKAAAQPLVDQLKAARDAKKQKLQQLQPLMQQDKDLHQKIVKEEAAKNQLWTSYANQVKVGDFTSAGNTLQSIIDAKTQIIKDIKAKGDVLNQLLNAINSLNGSQQSSNSTQQ